MDDSRLALDTRKSYRILVDNLEMLTYQTCLCRRQETEGIAQAREECSALLLGQHRDVLLADHAVVGLIQAHREQVPLFNNLSIIRQSCSMNVLSKLHRLTQLQQCNIIHKICLIIPRMNPDCLGAQLGVSAAKENVKVGAASDTVGSDQDVPGGDEVALAVEEVIYQDRGKPREHRGKVSRIVSRLAQALNRSANSLGIYITLVTTLQ